MRRQVSAWLEVEGGSSPTEAAPQPEGSFADELVIGADLQPIRRPAVADRNPAAAHLRTQPPVCQLAVDEREARLKRQRCATGISLNPKTEDAEACLGAEFKP